MRYLSVCSGIEAASVAWHPLGWEPAAFCEIEPFPAAVLKERYPHVPNYGDFTRLSQPDHPIRSAGIDLLVGGTPCQAFSVAGLRSGFADPRGGLTLEFVRLAKALQSRWIVWENVPGVLSQDAGRAFGAFLGALGDLGYGWAYRVLDAQYVRVDGYPRAVPQRRKRVFVVACAGGQSGRAGAVLFEPEGVRRDSPPRRASRQDAAVSAAGGVEVAGCLQHRDSKGVDSDTKPGHILPVAFDARQTDVCVYGDKSGPLDTDPGTIGVCVTGDRTHALTTRSAAEEDGTGRGTPIVPSGMSVRRLTPTECERLQGFPDGWTAIPWKGKPVSECPDGPRYRALGNSMAVNVMRWIGRRIEMVDAL